MRNAAICGAAVAELTVSVVPHHSTLPFVRNAQV
jgi:hypothetical protein